MLGNYKICVNNEAESKEAQELFFELGYKWLDGELFQYTDAMYLFSNDYGTLGYHNHDDDFFKKHKSKELDLPQLRTMVASHRKPEKGLISGTDALAMVHTCTVQYSCSNDPVADRWTTITDHFWDQYNLGVFLNQDTTWKFRIKPRTITLNVEIPAPFEPKYGDYVFSIDSNAADGWTSFMYQASMAHKIIYGAWRTEEEIKQVVASLRGAICKK